MITVGTKEGYALIFKNRRELEHLIRNLHAYLEYCVENKQPNDPSVIMFQNDTLASANGVEIVDDMALLAYVYKGLTEF